MDRLSWICTVLALHADTICSLSPRCPYHFSCRQFALPHSTDCHQADSGPRLLSCAVMTLAAARPVRHASSAARNGASVRLFGVVVKLVLRFGFKGSGEIPRQVRDGLATPVGASRRESGVTRHTDGANPKRRGFAPSTPTVICGCPKLRTAPVHETRARIWMRVDFVFAGG